MHLPQGRSVQPVLRNGVMGFDNCNGARASGGAGRFACIYI